MSSSLVNATLEKEMERHFRAIGRVVVEWSRLKSYIREMVRMLAGIDNQFGECLTEQISDLDKLLAAISALLNLRSPGSNDDDQFKIQFENLRSLNRRTYSISHDVWTFDPGSASVWTTDFPKRPTRMSVNEVNSLAKEIDNAAEEFLRFRRNILVSLSLWPGP